MARANKYTSLNFNDIYDKKNTTTNNNFSPSSSPSTSSKSYLSSATKSYGGMLVLSRPSPKPQPTPSPASSPSSAARPGSPDGGSDLISLRPKGKTGGTNLSMTQSPPSSEIGGGRTPKSDKFVPPHLRPGFVAKEVSSPPAPEFARARSGNYRPGSAHGYHNHGSPNGNNNHNNGYMFMENGRPKTGGESDVGYLNRPRSGGARPSSSGW